jgi:ferritin-like metal-binding protein YciE
MEKMNDLSDLLKHEIEDLYSVEEQIIEALPKMIEKANNKTLKDALSEHLKVTEEHKNRLDKIQKTMKMNAEEGNGKKKGFLKNLFGSNHECKGMKGIIEEGNKILGADISPKTLDAAIIACAQKVEHYEICGYGTARTYARELGLEPVAKLLEQTLNEEYEADDKLTALAVQRINLEAETESEGGDPTASGNTKGRSGREQGNERTRTRERAMEPVADSRSASAKTTSGREGSEKGGGPKASGTPRSNGTSRSAASKKTSAKSASAKTSRSNGRSSSGGRGTSSRSSSGR